MSKPRKEKRDTGGTPLTSNPFASLKEQLGGSELPEQRAGASNASRAEIVPKRDWTVPKTRKGGWPLSIEKRGGGKVVTVIEPVEGDSNKLLKALRKQCGAGGAAKPGRAELQGDHREAIQAFLDQQP